MVLTKGHEGGSKKMTNTTQWEVVRYGQLIERSDIEIGDIGVITTIIYKYQNKYYVKLWDTGYCIHFSELVR